MNIKNQPILKDIDGYEGLYATTKDGQIWSYKHKKFMSPTYTKKGRLRIGLSKNGAVKYFYIHRIVATTFVPNPENLPCVNHKDENKLNNNAENLEWCTVEYNNNYGTRNQRIGENRKNKRMVICLETKCIYKSLHEATRETGIGFQNIYACCNHNRNTAGGYHWEYYVPHEEEL